MLLLYYDNLCNNCYDLLISLSFNEEAVVQVSETKHQMCFLVISENEAISKN